MSPEIPSEEFADRRRRAVEGARAAGLDGLLVCSRGGGSLDRYADVKYLANYYTLFPYIPDVAGQWTARAHTFLILPVDGSPELVIDVPDDGSIRLEDGKVTYADLVMEAAIAALETAGLSAGRVGLVGSDVMTLQMSKALSSALPGMRLEPADEIVGRLRAIKSPLEIEKMRAASQLGSRAIEAMLDAAEPGASHGDVVAAGMQVIAPARAMLYNSFMASGQAGDPPKLVKSIFPTWGSEQRLEKGDWFRIGLSGVLDGYVFDLARAKAVGPATNRQVEAFETAIAAVETGIAAVRPGVTAGELAAAGLGKQEELGFPVKGVFSALGHGVGLGWDSPWLARGDETPIVPGMVLCFERTVTKDGYLGDFEETVVVRQDGAEKLTDARIRSW